MQYGQFCLYLLYRDELIIEVLFCRTEPNDESLICHYSNCLGLNIKYWTSPDLSSMRWLGLFTNKTFRKHRKLIFPHRDFIICIVSLAIFHPHFIIRIFPSAFFFLLIIRNFPSSFYHPHFSIRLPPSAAIRSALYRDPGK